MTMSTIVIKMKVSDLINHADQCNQLASPIIFIDS